MRSQYWRQNIIVLSLVTPCAVLLFINPIHQDLGYHQFADRRSWLFVVNYLNVISNLPFMIGGALGLRFCLAYRQIWAPYSWPVFFMGIILVSFGSSYYHWMPSNSTLVWDRIPMTISFMALFVALTAEHINTQIEKYLLFPALFIGISSVVYWHYTDDLRPYAWVQFGPMITLPFIVLLYEGKYSHPNLIFGLLLYGLAKVVEYYDWEIFLATGRQLSGHTLKHLLAALSVVAIYFMLKQRKCK